MNASWFIASWLIFSITISSMILMIIVKKEKIKRSDIDFIRKLIKKRRKNK